MQIIVTIFLFSSSLTKYVCPLWWMSYFLQVNIWSYLSRKLIHSIETGHSANIFCTKFIPETSNELVVSGAADAEVTLSWQTENLYMTLDLNWVASVSCSRSDVSVLQVRLFNLSRSRRTGMEGNGISPSAVFQCHTRRVKKLAVISSFCMWK